MIIRDAIRYTERCFKYKRFHKKYVGAVFGLHTVKMYFSLKIVYIQNSTIAC